MKNEKCCSQLSTYFKRHIALRRQMSHLSAQKKFDSFFKPASLRSKTSKASELSIDE
jgi:hypothetical protein